MDGLRMFLSGTLSVSTGVRARVYLLMDTVRSRLGEGVVCGGCGTSI